jgi:hypothetical protein
MANVNGNGADSSPTDTESHAVTLHTDLQNLRTVLISEITATIATQLKTAIDAALAPFSTVLDGVRAAADEQGRQIDGFEHDLCDDSDRIVALEKTVAWLSSENQKLIDKTDDLESRSRVCNLCCCWYTREM